MADIVPGVPWRWVASPNHGGLRATTRLVIVHSSRSGKPFTLEQEYQATVSYCSQSVGSQVGPHFVIGPAEVTRMVHDSMIAWHGGNPNPALSLNPYSVAFEIAQPYVTTHYTEFQYRAAADITAKWCEKYGLPIAHPPRYSDATSRGILGHEETRDGQWDGKTDPGPQWDWVKFLQYVKEAGMTAAERARVDECAGHVYQTNEALAVAIADLRRVTGTSALIDELERLKAEYHNWGVAYPKQNAGLG